MASLRDVDARNLAALLAVVDEGTFAKGAKALGFTQSAVSQQIAALEKAAGLPVFDRPKGPRAAELTAAGSCSSTTPAPCWPRSNGWTTNSIGCAEACPVGW